MRKVLSFVLVLALVLGSFSMAFGLTDITGSDKEDAVNVCNDLGIITGFPDGTFKPDQAVNRAEFAAMITRALGIPDSALAAYTATSFKDVAGYGWAVKYLAFCESKGIMEGDGMGNVMPGRTISVNESITMVLRAVGYTNNAAVLVGSWPANYVTLAQDLGIYDDVDAVATVDRGNAAQIIYNTLTVEKVQVNSDGETNEADGDGIAGNNTMLTSGLKAASPVGKELLGSAGYSFDEAMFSILPNLGAYGDAYVKTDGSGDVVAFTKDSTALTGYLDGTQFVSGGVKYNFVAPCTSVSTAAFFVNGAEQAAVSTIAAGVVASETGTVTINVDLSGKNIYDIYSIVAWATVDNEEVTAADLEAIEDGTLLSGDFQLDDDDNIIQRTYALVGVDSLDDIEAGDLVYVYYDGTDNIRKVAVANSSVTGQITEKDGRKVTVDGTVYEFYNFANTQPTNAVADTGFSAGDDVVLTLDANGKIWKAESSSSADNFGVMTAVDMAASALDSDRVRMYLASDEAKTFNMTDGTDLTYNGTVGAAAPWAGTTASTGAILKYGLNSDGEVNNIDVTRYANASAATLSSISVVDVSGAGVLLVADDVVVFAWNNTTATLDVVSINDVTLKVDVAHAVAGFGYVTNTDNEVTAMLIDVADASRTSDDIYAVVNKVTQTVDADGDAIQRLVGFAGGVAMDKVTVGNNATWVTNTTVAATQFTLNADGKIKDATSAAAISTVTSTISGINAAKTAIQLGATWYPLHADVVVYEAVTKTNGTQVDYYKVSSVSSMRAAANYSAWIYDFDTTSTDSEGYEVVVFVKY